MTKLRVHAEAAGFSSAGVAGLVLILIAACLCVITSETWDDWMTWGVAADAPGQEAAQPIVAEWLRWLRWGLVVVAGLGALSLLPSKPISVLITASLVAVTVYCGDALLGLGLSWRPVVVGATGLGYLIECWPRPAGHRLSGGVGLILVGLACLGVARGWFDWVAVAGWLGTGPSEMIAGWGQELAWLTVLLLVVAGVFCSRTKPVHFLVALLLVVLAYHCVMEGKVEIRHFPELSKPGKLISEIDVRFSNVEAWRWVLAAELILIATVLSHKALGIGSLNLAFALAWMILGCGVYSSIGSMSVARSLGEWIALSAKWQEAAGDGDRRQGFGPLANMGLPIGHPPADARPIRIRPQPRSQRAESPAATGRNRTEKRQNAKTPRGGKVKKSKSQKVKTPKRQQDNPILSPKQGAAGTPGAQSRKRNTAGVSDQALAKLKQEAIVAAAASTRQAVLREIVRQVWIYLTAILAGVIAVTGLGLLLGSEGSRAWLSYGLWLGLGVALAMLWQADPKESGQSYLSWISDWTQSRYKLHAVWLIFLATSAVAGSWALRGPGHMGGWIDASIACMFAGTVLSLIGVAVLIYFGGFAPLPVWTYGAIAGGQSSLAWVLMIRQNWVARKGPTGPLTA